MKIHALPTLVAAGCALACGAASAQSSVKLSGFLDVAAISTVANGARTTKLGGLGASDLVFSGTEDLGGGVAATFRLASRFELDSGLQTSRSFFHEESTVGLAGGFGSIRLGRGLTALWNTDWQYDPWGNFDRVASPAWQLYHGNSPSSPASPTGGAPGTTGLATEYARIDNGIFYQSPTLGGFKVEVTGEVERNSADPDAKKRNLGGAIHYSQGALNASIAAERNSRDNKVYFAGIKYNLGAATLMAAYDHEKAPSGQTYFTGKSDNRTATLGATYTVDATTLKLGYGRQLDAHANFIGAGVSYALSKRTNLVASVGHSGKKLWGASDASTAYGVGINHSF
ncbi:porin [Ramlibacter sp. WS9]|uniref:porin n=1 Tax=Ramlibacter sp. WS9 TaxID=1882741 RepID=UPI001305122A|nr:porin [Ramlibacter sp. WS9]